MATYDQAPAAMDRLTELNARNQHLRQEHDALYREACKSVEQMNARLENQLDALRAQLSEQNRHAQELPSVVPPAPSALAEYNRQPIGYGTSPG